MSITMQHFNSNEWFKNQPELTSHHAMNQEDLQTIAKKIRENCKVQEILNNGSSVCTIYANENLGIRYWIHDYFGHISEIIEGREF